MIVLALLILGGCAADFQDLGREPRMSPLGSGLRTAADPHVNRSFPPPRRTDDESLWDDSSTDLFTDSSARRVGDVVTVNIAINDRAIFGNTSARSTDTSDKLGFNLNFNKEQHVDDAVSLGSQATSQGQGSINRSEKIQLAIAAVVTGVLPNGNLVISGSQEVRVNYELRLLKIAGIVQPQDISKDNTISYDKIAEARISYGGRGRISEVQQPSWGQQIFDAVKPF